MKIPVGIVDDHQLFLKSLSMMLGSFQNFSVSIEALNGIDLQHKIQVAASLPDIMLIDVSMPVMDGFATAKWLSKQYPTMKLVALSMNDNDRAIIGMIKAGCCAYLLKDTHPNDLEIALNDIALKGYYNGDVSNINYSRLLKSEKKEELLKISAKEKEFLQFACTDMTYKHIAAEMGVSERTVDGYRENLFGKFNVQSRVGLALEAIRKDLVKL